MTEDEPRTEPTTDEPGADVHGNAVSPAKDTRATNDAESPDEKPDKTDMSAVGDDGQVFGG